MFFCVCERGALKPPSIPTLDLPLLYLKKYKKDILEANREMPAKAQSLVDDLATTD